MARGNGNIPTKAELLTHAIQEVIDEAVSEASTMTETHLNETRELAAQIRELRADVSRLGRSFLEQSKDVAVLKVDVAEIRKLLEDK